MPGEGESGHDLMGSVILTERQCPLGIGRYQCILFLTNNHHVRLRPRSLPNSSTNCQWCQQRALLELLPPLYGSQSGTYCAGQQGSAPVTATREKEGTLLISTGGAQSLCPTPLVSLCGTSSSRVSCGCYRCRHLV